MTKDELADQRAALAHAKSVLVESAATEVVSIGRVYPELQRQYRLYKRSEAALALPAGRSAWRLCISRTASLEQVSASARSRTHQRTALATVPPPIIV
jgi:hypothetical protein